jgi:serine phosphatase RsbU (regulator of sigma subunit)
LGNYFSDYFILYKPKDIVSGDFYWFNEVNGQLIIAAADCTGHGVPGGFMSMIGTDKLNHAVFEKGETDTGKILSIISQGVKTALKQDDSENASRDGMDVSLCSFGFGVSGLGLSPNNKLSTPSEPETRNSKPQTGFSKPETPNPKHINLLWSGANRPLWIIQNSELTELKPTKAAIGGFTADDVVFETTKLELKKGTSLYMFSDGYADQFGTNSSGIEKKMTTRKFREQLLSIQHLSMTDQKINLHHFFESWRKDIEQIDDVLIIGLKL